MSRTVAYLDSTSSTRTEAYRSMSSDAVVRDAGAAFGDQFGALTFSGENMRRRLGPAVLEQLDQAREYRQCVSFVLFYREHDSQQKWRMCSSYFISYLFHFQGNKLYKTCWRALYSDKLAWGSCYCKPSPFRAPETSGFDRARNSAWIVPQISTALLFAGTMLDTILVPVGATFGKLGTVL